MMRDPRWLVAVRCRVVVAVALALLAAGCMQSDTGASAAPAEACVAGDPECDDTFVPDDDLPTTEPERGVPVADAIARPIDGAFEVRGFFFADGFGARVCEMLLESLPPQCGGASIPVGDFELDVPVVSESGVTWSPDVVLLEGEIIGGVFQPLR